MKSKALKVIIAGSRWIEDYDLISKAIKASGFNIGAVICGEAAGPDTLGAKWAIENGIEVISKPAKWRVGGRTNFNAGFERNEEMGNEADAAICIWDGKSGGTKHMINYMRKLNKPCFVYKHDTIDLFDYFDMGSVKGL